MIVSIHQPDYIPYLGYFYKIYQSDIFVFLDDCQFSSDNWHHWNRIKTSQGECRLKIPTTYKLGDKIKDVQTKDYLKWKEKHLKTIEMNYKKTKYFNEIFPMFKELLMAKYDNLADMNIEINTYFAMRFGMAPRFLRTSKMDIKTVRAERVIDICKKCKGAKYISGLGAKAYQVEGDFIKEGITLQYTDFKSFKYPQAWKDFVPNLSVLDYIFNCGYDFDKIYSAIKFNKESV